MANVSRKAVAAALLATIAPPTSPFGPRVGRRLTKPENVASPDNPALFLIKPREKHTAIGEGLPPMRELRFFAIIFTDVGSDATAVPADIIDDLVDYVTGTLAVPMGQRQTLGIAPAVYDCVIDGEALFAPGDNQGKGETIVPIKLTLGQYP